MSEFLDLDTMLSKIPVPRLPRPLDESVPLYGGQQGQGCNAASRSGNPWAGGSAAATKTETEDKVTGKSAPPKTFGRRAGTTPADRPSSLSYATAGEQQPEVTSQKAEVGNGKPPCTDETTAGGVSGAAAATATSSAAAATVDERGGNQTADAAANAASSVCAGCGAPVKATASTLESDVRDIRRMLQTYAGRLGERDAHARTTKQWRLVARVFDRLFFFIYCATIIISLATIFPRG
jgi:hypothetical protein